MSYTVEDLIADLEEVERITGRGRNRRCGGCGEKGIELQYNCQKDSTFGGAYIATFHSCDSDSDDAFCDCVDGWRGDKPYYLDLPSEKSKHLARKMFRLLWEIDGAGTQRLRENAKKYRHLKFWKYVPKNGREACGQP